MPVFMGEVQAENGTTVTTTEASNTITDDSTLGVVMMLVLLSVFIFMGYALGTEVHRIFGVVGDPGGVRSLRRQDVKKPACGCCSLSCCQPRPRSYMLEV